jgi:hypothetical protein
MLFSICSNSEDFQDLVPKGLGCLVVAFQRLIWSTSFVQQRSQTKDSNVEFLHTLNRYYLCTKQNRHIFYQILDKS